MTVVKLAKFTDDADDVLRDVKNAAFAREHRLPAATALDFTGVAGVTLAFLDELFRGAVSADEARARLARLGRPAHRGATTRAPVSKRSRS